MPRFQHFHTISVNVLLVFLAYNCIMLHHHFSLSQAKVSRVSALICSKSSSWKLIDESMNRWLPNDFCRQRRAFCRVADPKSSASQQSDGLKVLFGPPKKQVDRIKGCFGKVLLLQGLGKSLEKIQVRVVIIARTWQQEKQCPSEDVHVAATRMRLACPRMSWSEDVEH